ncbi:MAG TPA: VOC family protein [Streptosporangiaceae bacterium]|nr:VOC family protein [Streptosporangiaceae bacterium]
MITGISFVAVPVDDIDEALQFYCDVLGMEKRVDAPAAGGNRFVEVAPPQSPVALAPYTYYGQEPRATIGEYSRVVLCVDDVRRAYEELTAKGVRFDGEPFESAGGTFAAMRDPWGNFFVLSQSQPAARS